MYFYALLDATTKIARQGIGSALNWGNLLLYLALDARVDATHVLESHLASGIEPRYSQQPRV